MGRGVQKNGKKPVSISTDGKREAWMKKRAKHFDGASKYNVRERAWIIMTDTKDLGMIDKQLVVDQDGENVYRLVHLIGKDGIPMQDNGYVRVLSTTFLREQYCAILPDEWQEKLDAWLKTSITEDKLKEDEHGFVFPTLECKPCNLKVPGWERLSPAALKKRREDNIRQLVGQFFKF